MLFRDATVAAGRTAIGLFPNGARLIEGGWIVRQGKDDDLPVGYKRP